MTVQAIVERGFIFFRLSVIDTAFPLNYCFAATETKLAGRKGKANAPINLAFRSLIRNFASSKQRY